jgi:hypothetical protein
MIIKSMTRKQATFSQLVDYFDEEKKHDNSFNIYHNLYANNSENVKEEFSKNAEFLKERKNGVFMYHEILSVTKSSKISLEKQKEILMELAQKYLQERAKNNLAYGVLHDDKSDNLHYHFMISSNEASKKIKHRLTKNEFDKIKKDLENYVLNMYPEMEQKTIINKTKDEKTSTKEYELKKRTGKLSDRDQVKSKLKEVFEKSKTKQEFFNNLADSGFELYIHGNTIGVKTNETGLNYRLKTLGLLDEFYEISPRIQEIENRKEEVKWHKNNDFSREKVDTRNYRNSQQEAREKESKENVGKNEKTSYSEPEKPEKSTYEKQYHNEQNKPLSEDELEILRRKEEVRKARESSKGDDFEFFKNIG